MQEEWKPTKDYKQYEVSNLGRVRNKNTGRILKPFIHPNGYHYLTVAPLGRQGKKVTFKVHRLVAEAFIDNPDNHPIVNHKDGNKINNLCTNLEWLTYKDNAIHAVETGLFVALKGEQCEQTVLSEELIEEIRKQIVKGSRHFGVRAMARKYNIAYSTLCESLLGVRTWKHLKDT